MKSKAHFMERVSREMDSDLPELSLSTEEALAACCRILASKPLRSIAIRSIDLAQSKS